MPCSTCNTPNQVLHSDDMELCQMLMEFFEKPQEYTIVPPEKP